VNSDVVESGFMGIGIGNGLPPFPRRPYFGHITGGQRFQEFLEKNGANKSSQKAVNDALEWFQKHQDPNGFWQPETYFNNCPVGTRCEPAKKIGDSDKKVTAYALLCYLGAGYNHKSHSRFKEPIAKGITWLLTNQKTDGSWGRNDINGLCAQAIIEAYGMTKDPQIKDSAQKAVDYILSQQNRLGSDESAVRLGWDVVGPSDCNDTIITGQMILTLHVAALSELKVGNWRDGAKTWLESAWKAANPQWHTLTSTGIACAQFPMQWKVGAEEPRSATSSLSLSIAAQSAVLLKMNREASLLNSLCNGIIQAKFDPCELEFLLYANNAMFQMGGERWTKWNGITRDLLVKTQLTSKDCFGGSWDWKNAQYSGDAAGRLLSTAYACLSLEVYRRYRNVYP
jgi:hypothetical protein